MLVRFSNNLFSHFSEIINNSVCQRHGFHTCCFLLKNPDVSQLKILKTTRVVVKKKTEVPIQTLINWHKINLKLYGPVIKEVKTKKDATVSTTKISSQAQKKKELKQEKILHTTDEFSGTNFENEVVSAQTSKDEMPKILSNIAKKKKLKTEKIPLISDKTFKPNFGIDNIPVFPLPEGKFSEILIKAEEKKNSRSERENLLPSSNQFSKINVGIEDTPLPLQPSIVQNKLHLFSPNGFTQPFTEKNNILLPFPLVMNKQSVTQSSQEIYSIPNNYPRSLPSVTSILSITMPESSAIALATWRKRKIIDIGEEGLEIFMREAKRKGKDFHTSIETHLRGVDYDSVHVEPRISGYWLSLKSVLESIKGVVLLESFVVHPQLQYKGCVDCVARFKTTLVLIDWKTSDRRKNTLKAAYDDPVQIAAYMGALNADSNYPFEVKDAVLVVAYPTGLPADVLVLNQEMCEHYWQIWLQRLQLYNSMKRSS